ncbi:MAG: diguanylate cyclase, partial [Oscillospiraceae bacterium]|nr:diguanylate cyclase [Oscillospiraceae bacterium]
MELFENVSSSTRYAEIRIDFAKNFPVTVYGDIVSGGKTKKLFLGDVVSTEDLPFLINQIDDIIAGNQSVLQAHARIKTGEDYSWFLIRCGAKKEKFGKTRLEGFIFDVSNYLDFAGEDHVLLEFKKKNEEKAERITNSELTLSDILGDDFLLKIQVPLQRGGVCSAIFDDSDNLISSLSDSDTFPFKKHKYTKQVEIRISRVVAAQWLIAAPTAELIEKNAHLLDVLTVAVSRTANSFVMLYNEMDNSEHANKLLSEHIEQQILINNVYNIILERKDSSEALKAIIKLVGEYMGMRRVCVYEDFPGEEKIRLSYQWKSSRSPDSALPEYSYSDLGKIIERLEYTDMYIPTQSPEQSDENKLKLEYCTAGNLNGDGKRFGIITFAPLSPGYVPTAQESKVLRSISQITATLLIQMKADEKLKEADDKLRRLAFYDPILEIPNRAMLDRDLDSELDSGGRGAAAVIKITNLQIFNELFGHEYTDNMLHDAAMFVSDMKVTGLTVYRFSGNTLMFLLRENSEEGVKKLIEKIMKRFGQPWLHENGEHYLDAGIGATFYPDGHSTRGEIYRAAALAMYKATEYGANSYAFYSDDFKTEADVNYSHIQRLHECVNNDMKGFSIEYQPMAAADGGLTDCYEAYVRWEYLPTQKLIQLAESTGLDVAVDSWVIKNACLFCKKMQEHKPDFS